MNSTTPKQGKPASSDWKVGLILLSVPWGWNTQSHLNTSKCHYFNSENLIFIFLVEALNFTLENVAVIQSILQILQLVESDSVCTCEIHEMKDSLPLMLLPLRMQRPELVTLFL